MLRLFSIVLFAGLRFCLASSHGMIRRRDLAADDRPESAQEVCEGLTSIVQEGYPADKMTVTCHCNGILIPDPTTGNFVPIQGKYSLICRSDNFFTSPDGSVWWYISFQADFDTRSLYQIRQTATYVKGREYKEGRTFKEDFILYFDKEHQERHHSCDARVTGSLGYQNSCDTCAKLPKSTEDNLCFQIGCSNVNVGSITNGQYIDSIDDSCDVMPITDFTEPFAASVGFLQDDVQEVFPQGGATCVELIADAFKEFGDDIECTCFRVNGSYNNIGADDVGTSYELSCRMPCVYGPEDGSVEYIKYYETKYTKKGIIFRYEWKQWRYEYILGREDSEIFRQARDDSGYFLPDLCTAWQNDVACESCGFTSWTSHEILLDCTNLSNGINWDYTDAGSSTLGDWETTPFAARYRGDAICLRSVDAENPASQNTLGATCVDQYKGIWSSSSLLDAYINSEEFCESGWAGDGSTYHYTCPQNVPMFAEACSAEGGTVEFYNFSFQCNGTPITYYNEPDCVGGACNTDEDREHIKDYVKGLMIERFGGEGECTDAGD